MSERHVLMARAFLRRSLIVLIVSKALPPTAAWAQQTIGEYTNGMERHDGYIPFFWDAATGRLLLETPRLGEEFLYLTSLATGLGSNALGLDRGMIGTASLARFERTGPKAMLVLENPTFRATGGRNAALARSVEESFPVSTIGTFEVLAEGSGHLLVDATSLFLRDAMDVRRRFRQRNQGAFQLDRASSHVFLPRTRAFPENTEVEAALTFTSDDPGPEVRRHSPDGRRITLRQHHSFVKLPDDGYRPRRFDPRIGIFPLAFYDYSRGFAEGYVERYMVRHRLVKRDPNAAVSEPIQPIIYYLDAGVPEPYRTAFKEGAGWYNQVFESAGFRNAFRVEDMPPDMDPLDARYHVIQWVHRTEAGSSIGPSLRDPRTGEIIKAAVRMDSHRSLVDFDLYAAALPSIAGDQQGDLFSDDPAVGDWIASLDAAMTPEDFAMARRRQHSAHEIGHTLGLAHNFIAASYGRASVMDYPAPLIRLVNGEIDLSDAYRPGPGAYDSIAIRFAYTQFPEGEEEAGLRAILAEAEARGFKFITNPHEGIFSSNPAASTWVNGSDMVAELDRVTAVRRALIDRFDETAIAEGEPMALLNRRFVTVYLHHRFTLQAAIKAIGGMEFRYAVRGDGLPPTEIISPATQRRAFELLLDAIQPAALEVPEGVLRILAPTPFGHANDPRAFPSDAAPAFDQIGVARTLATMVVRGILHPQRAARVVAIADREPDAPSLEEIVQRMIERTWESEPPDEHPTLKRVAERVVLDELISLATNPDATVEARAAAAWGVGRIGDFAAGAAQATGPEEEAHLAMASLDVQRFFNSLESAPGRSTPQAAPPGTPIGNR
jgi:hypothetical protein